MIDLMEEPVVRAVLETIPGEITVIDANDRVIGWNKHHHRLFHRPEAAMEMDFRQCHPQKSLHRVERIISEMKSGKRDRARFWIDLKTSPEARHKVVIEFFALRDPRGQYLGCLEHTLDIEDYRKLEGERRLLDETGILPSPLS